MKQKFYRKILKNGMTVIFEKRNIPVVSVIFAVKQGGVNEHSKEKGISHFIEHMLYKGTPARNAKQIAEAIERRGGDLNGFTDEGLTAYWCKLPSKHLNVALEVLGDMVRNPLFNEKEMEKEKQVIFEEIKMYKDSPMRYVGEGIHEMLYEKPFGIPLIGNFQTVGSLTRKQIFNKFKEAYQPENMILCVVGDAEFKQITNYAEKNFSKRKGKIQKLKVIKKNQTKIEKRKGIDQANFIFAYHIPKAKDERSYAAFTLNALMTDGMSSRIFHEIREKRNLAYAIKGSSDINNDFANNYIFVGAKKENIQKVKSLILKEFEKVSKNLGEKEFSEVKEQLIGSHQLSMENSQTQMIGLLLNEINGNAKDLYDFENKIKAVKLTDVKAIAKKAIKEYSFFALVPE